MIRIHKSQDKDIIPKKLSLDGKKQTTKDKRAFSRKPDQEYSSKNNFIFDAKIYGDTSVKDLLKKIQHNKCCFCEIKVGKYDADIEHFRPKSCVQESKNDPLQYPGYYWLAYDWDNLLLCCATCNRSYKRSFFPLINPENRAKNHKEDLNLEKPIFINPSKENPEDFISFEGDISYGIDLQQRGKITIEYLGLDRNELCEKRLEKLNILKLLFNTIESAKNYPEDEQLRRDAIEAQGIIDQWISDKGEFSAAARCAIANDFEYVL